MRHFFLFRAITKFLLGTKAKRVESQAVFIEAGTSNETAVAEEAAQVVTSTSGTVSFPSDETENKLETENNF